MPKKKTALTIEERLQQALVPAEEQPYEVPENWVWVRLGAVCNASKEKSNDFSNDIKYIGLEHLEKDQGIVGFSSADKVKSTKNAFKKGQILYGRLRPYLNKHDICSFDGVCSTDILVFEASNLVSNVLVDKFLNLPFFIDYVVSNSKGINLPRVSEETVLNTTFPLPPLSEQQRIVERIEELFAKLDEAKERLQEVADSFVVRKAAILHKAFTGELTKQWRREKGVSDESWEEKKLGEVGSWLGGGTPSTSREEYWENGNILWITSKDMKSAVIEDTLMKVNEIGVKNSSANYIEKPALLVVMRSGILRRTFPVAMVKKPFTVNQDLKAIIPDKDDLEFLYWMLLSNEQRILDTCMKNGTTVESINSNALKDLTFKCPTLPEQHEIVRLIDDLLARERAAQQATEQALASIDLMKKSILARAFRGELGTNKASEASALELLRQVLAED